MSSPWPTGPPPPTGTDHRPGPITLVWLVVAGPAVWMVHLAGAAALVPLACQRAWGSWAINGLTVGCSLVIAWAAWWSWRIYQRHRPEGLSPDRVVAVMALLALGWNLISLLVTVVEGAPNLVLGACPQ